MRLFAIGDLHLSGADEKKPMDVFGPQWDRHFLRIRENWRSVVREEDAVLIPGDISWAMQLKDAIPDLQAIAALPGRKILIKGNHDYWWNSLAQVRAAAPESLTMLQFDAVDLGPWVVCGTRGWMIPTAASPLGPEDEKIYRRETGRLNLALDRAEALAKGKPVVVMLHYPPLLQGERCSAFTQILEKRGVHTAVYGHLHGEGTEAGFHGSWNGVNYHLVSCDSIHFCPKEIPV